MASTSVVLRPQGTPRGTPRGTHRIGLLQRLGSAAARAWRAFDRWHTRVSRRRTMAHLSPRLLKDIGVTPEPERVRTTAHFRVV